MDVIEAKINEDLLEDMLAKVEQARNWGPRVISKLENTVRTGSDDELFRLNPIEWAHAKSIDEQEAVDLFLYSAKAGLFNADWNIICPCCGLVMHSLRNLHQAQSRNVCPVCFRDDRSTLDDYVQVSFTLSPTVRTLIYHHPEDMPLVDYCFKYLFARNARIQGLGGAEWTMADFFNHSLLHMAEFMPNDKLGFEWEVSVPKVIGFNDMLSQQAVMFIVDGEPTSEVQEVSIRFTDEGFEVSLPPIDPGKLQIAQKFLQGTIYTLRPGRAILDIEHSGSSKAGLIVWGAAVQMIAEIPDVYFTPSLTAKRLFACQTFHDLFRSEVFRESEGFGVKDVTILFTDLKASTQLYNEIGDLNAFALVREHYGVLNRAIINQRGAVVKTIGDAIMASFIEPGDAVQAGLEMLNGLHEMNANSGRSDLILKIGIHRGAAISVTLNDRIDYFGQSVNTASRVQSVAGGDEIYITDDIYSSAGVADLLKQRNCGTESMRLELKGIDQPVKVYKVTNGLG
jgi:class 3 adenylate cyclase